jgi:hypothetical protein
MIKFIKPVIFIALISSYTLFAQDETISEDITADEDTPSFDDTFTDEETPFDEDTPADEDVSFDEEPSSGGGWGNSIGSCCAKGDMNISLTMPIWPIGFFSAFDYAFHDCISAGGGIGIYGYSFNPYWRYHYMPIIARAAFHPFNLSVWADKIKARNKLDVYVGLATGARIGWVSWEGSGTELPEPKITRFLFREYIGIRFYPTEKFYLVAEEGGALLIFSFGVGLKF